MKMKRFATILLLFIVVLLTACKNASTPQPAAGGIGKKVAVDGGFYADISVAELQTMLANKDFVFVNVHIPFEGNIAQTDLSIPYDQIEQNVAKLPTDMNTKIVLYCRSGRMSAIAAETLVRLRFSNVWNLSGGMAAWEQVGLPIER
jgi:rhodanese-related sulfurtransferase